MQNSTFYRDNSPGEKKILDRENFGNHTIPLVYVWLHFFLSFSYALFYSTTTKNITWLWSQVLAPFCFSIDWDIPEKKTGGGILFGIFRFLALTLEIPDKTKLHSLGKSKAKNQDPRNSKSFSLDHPRKIIFFFN